MKSSVKKRKRPMIIAATAVVSIAAVIAAVFIIRSFFTDLNGKYIYRSEKTLDLRSSGMNDVSELMALEGPETIDLRDNPITAEQYESNQT